MFFKRIVLILVVLAAAAPLTLAQHANTGLKPFGTYQTFGPDTIDLATLNVHLEIPIISKTGRGLPFDYVLRYDSPIWAQGYVGGVLTWQHDATWGWQGQSEVALGYVTYVSTPVICYDPDTRRRFNRTEKSDWRYRDELGAEHHFDNAIGGCPEDIITVSSAQDGSGYTLHTPSTNNISVVTRSGRVIDPPLNPTDAGQATDPNGNEITLNGGSFTDTLGVQALTITGGSPNPLYLTYPTATGSAQYVVTYKQYTVTTNFAGCSAAPHSAAADYLVDRITLPDQQSYYEFGYETIPGTTNVTGRIASIKLPTGGVISYAYPGSNGGIYCTDGTSPELMRTTSDGQWHYTRSWTGSVWQTTVSAPNSSDTVYTFQGTSSTPGYQTVRDSYSGVANPSTLLQSVSTCYNADVSGCASHPVAMPISRITTIMTKEGLQAKTVTSYDGKGQVTNLEEYDWGTGAPGLLLRKTTTVYVPLGNVSNRPQSITVYDGNNHVQAQTNFSYDEGAPYALSVPQHVAVSGSRGNPTTVSKWVSGSTYLTTHYSYYDTGIVHTVQDPNTATTEFRFDGGGTSCTSSLPTATYLPLGLTRFVSWKCDGGVLEWSKDENDKSTSYAYNDPFWRLSQVTDASNPPNVTNFTYPDAKTSQSKLLFNNQQSVLGSRVKLDAYGRVHLKEQATDPTFSQFNIVQFDYDSMGMLAKVSLPYGGSVDFENPNAAGTTTQYDKLGRPSQVTDGGGGTTSYSYSANDVLVTQGPAPANENAKRRQLEYDGLGRLTSVCEITNGTSSGACGQTTSANGYRTAYAYVGLNILLVSQNAQPGGSVQSRRYEFDGLSRLTLEHNPESGSTNDKFYTYDSDATCNGSFPGDLIKVKDTALNVSCRTYDSLHRVKTVAYLSGPNAANTPSKSFFYDTAVVNGVTMENAKGRLAQAYTGASATDLGFSYDELGRVKTVLQKTPHAGSYYQVNAPLWPNGMPQSISGVPGGHSLSFMPDPSGLLGRIYDTTATKDVITQTSYNAANQPTSLLVKAAGSQGTPGTITYVQGKALQVTSGNTVSVTFSSANTAGNMIVVMVVNDSTDSVSVSDTAGNVYERAVGPTTSTWGFPYSQSIFYAKNIAAKTGNTVTATTTSPVTHFFILYVHEYAGADTASPFDIAAAASGLSGTSMSTPAVTTGANELILGGFTMGTGTAGAGFTSRLTNYGNVTEDKFVTAAGSYAATATQSSSRSWIGQVAAFKAAIVGAPVDATEQFTYYPETYRMKDFKFTAGTKSTTGTLNWNADGSARSLAIADSFNPSNNQTCSYSRDDLGRSANMNCGTVWQQTFTYDPFGNINKSGSSSFVASYVWPNLGTTNQIYSLPGATVSYDGNGNLLADGAHSYQWDADGNPVNIDGVGLTYDALGRMVEQARGTAYQQIVYAPSGAKLALMNGQTLVKEFVPTPNGGAAVFDSSGFAYFRHPDWLGSSRFAYNVRTGGMYSSTAYAPFGEPYGEAGPRDRSFTGQNEDTVIGLYDFLFREYSPTHGRWISPDHRGIAAVDFTKPQTWNRYGYALNTPLTLIDPLGLDTGIFQVGDCFFATYDWYTNDSGGLTVYNTTELIGCAGGPFNNRLASGYPNTGPLGGGPRRPSPKPKPGKSPNPVVDAVGKALHKVACGAVSPLITAATQTEGTIGAGLGGSAGLGLGLGVSVSGSLNVVADSYKNVGLAFSGGGNPGYGVYGAGAQGGRQFLLSSADTIFDLRGPYGGFSTSILEVGVSDTVSNEGTVNTFTATVGPGYLGRVSTIEAGGTAVPRVLSFNCSDFIP